MTRFRLSYIVEYHEVYQQMATTKHENAFGVFEFARTNAIASVERNVRTKFRKEEAPHRNCVARRVTQFKSTGREFACRQEFEPR